MSDNQTQPLTEHMPYEEIEQAQQKLAQEQAEKALQNLKIAFGPLAQVFKPMPKPEHVHGPFTFLLNQNHNALRGCQSCGQTWTGLMSGIQESDLRWHAVPEPIEEEEE